MLSTDGGVWWYLVPVKNISEAHLLAKCVMAIISPNLTIQAQKHFYSILKLMNCWYQRLISSKGLNWTSYKITKLEIFQEMGFTDVLCTVRHSTRCTQKTWHISEPRQIMLHITNYASLWTLSWSCCTFHIRMRIPHCFYLERSTFVVPGASFMVPLHGGWSPSLEYSL